MAPLADLMRVRVWPPLREIVAVTRAAFRAFSHHRTSRIAAALAYYTLFSLFPLLLLLLSIIGYLLDAGWPIAIDAREYLIRLTEDTIPAAGGLVSGAIESIQIARGASGLIGLFGLLWSASGTFNHLHIALDQIWGFNGTPAFRLTVKRRVTSIAFVLSMGLLLLAAQALKIVTHWLIALTDQIPGGGTVYSVTTWVFPFIVAVLVFAVMYHTFPSRPISWRDVWPGAILAAIGWELLKWLFVIYTARFANWQAVYGPVAGVIGLLTWLYFSFVIVLFGAEFAAALGSARAAWLRDLQEDELVPTEEIVAEQAQPALSLAHADREWGVGVMSGPVVGVIGVLAAFGIGIRLLVGGVRRFGRSSTE